LLDEHIWEGLAEALTQRGYDVLSIANTERRGIDDEAVLAFAAAEGHAVLTYNSRRFAPLVRLWYEANREHAGVILSIQTTVARHQELAPAYARTAVRLIEELLRRMAERGSKE
jgi:Domain of unknown function (DUF5615)